MSEIGFEALFEEPVNMTVSQGSDMDMPLRWLVDTVAVPLVTAGYDMRAQLRRKPGGDLWLDLTTTPDANGNVITLEDDGRITIHIDNVETEQTAWSASSRKSGFWDMEVIYPSGDVVRLVMGTVTVSREVTA